MDTSNLKPHDDETPGAGAAKPTPAPRPTPARELMMRIASAFVLAPGVIYLVYLGGWPFTGLVMLAALLMIYEWARLVRGSHLNADYVIHAITAIIAVALAGAGQPILALLAAFTGFAIGLGVVVMRGQGKRWPMIGFPYILLPCIAVVWLRSGGEWGMLTLYWLLAVVWATDIMAFVTGRTFGGPKLAPHLSPSKTWSGLLGGVAGAAVAGALTSVFLDLQVGWLLAMLSGMIAVIAQIGDIAESALKRYANVKDSGALIPGHGGVLDRVDGLIFAAVAAAMVALIGVLAEEGRGIGLGAFAG